MSVDEKKKFLICFIIIHRIKKCCLQEGKASSVTHNKNVVNKISRWIWLITVVSWYILLLPVDRCHCWWTDSPRLYYQPSSQYFGTGIKKLIVYHQKILLHNLTNNLSKVSPLCKALIPALDILFGPYRFLAPNIFNSFGFLFFGLDHHWKNIDCRNEHRYRLSYGYYLQMVLKYRMISF